MAALPSNINSNQVCHNGQQLDLLLNQILATCCNTGQFTTTRAPNGQLIYTVPGQNPVTFAETITTLTNPANTSIIRYINEGNAQVDIDICTLMQQCTIGQLQNVNITANTPNAGQVLRWNGTLWEPFTLTANPATQVDVFVNPAGTAVIRHTSVNGTQVDIDVCQLITNCNIGSLANVDPTANTPTNGQVLTWNGTAWVPQTIVTPTPDTFVNPAGTSIIRHTNIVGTQQDIDICVLLAQCTIGQLSNVSGVAPTNGQALVWNGTIWTPTAIATQPDTLAQVGTTSVIRHTNNQGTQQDIDLCAIIRANCSDRLVDNNDGTFTHTDVAGNAVIFDVRDDVFSTFDVAPQVVGAALGNPPAVLTTIGTPTTTAITNPNPRCPMVVQATIQGSAINIQQGAGGGPVTIRYLKQQQLDGAGYLAGQAGAMGNSLSADVSLVPGQITEINLPTYTFNFVIPPGGTRTLNTRTRWQLLAGAFNGTVSGRDEYDIKFLGVASCNNTTIGI